MSATEHRSRFEVLGILVVLTLAILGLFLQAIKASKARGKVTTPTAALLQISERQLDLGDIDSQSQKLFSFSVRNTGKTAVDDLEALVSCSCTHAQIQKNSLAPDESTEVTGYVDPNRRRGPIGSTIKITGRAVSNQYVETSIKLTAEAIPHIVVNPPLINYGDVVMDKPSENLTMTISVRQGAAGVDWDSLSTVSSPSLLMVSVEKKGSRVFEVKVTPKLQPREVGAFSDSLILNIAKDGRTLTDYKIVIPVTWKQVLGDLHVSPQFIYLGIVNPRSEVRGSVAISSDYKSLRFLSADFNKFIYFDDPGEKDSQLKLSYQTRPSVCTGNISSEINLRIKDAGTPITIRIPVLGYVSAQ